MKIELFGYRIVVEVPRRRKTRRGPTPAQRAAARKRHALAMERLRREALASAARVEAAWRGEEPTTKAS